MWTPEVTWQIKTINLLYHYTYGHQTCPFAEDLWEALPSLKITTDLTLVTGEIDKIIFPLLQVLWLLNFAGCWIRGECSERKLLICHQLLRFPLWKWLTRFYKTNNITIMTRKNIKLKIKEAVLIQWLHKYNTLIALSENQD